MEGFNAGTLPNVPSLSIAATSAESNSISPVVTTVIACVGVSVKTTPMKPVKGEACPSVPPTPSIVTMDALIVIV